jgi:magnesium chelatase family protein
MLIAACNPCPCGFFLDEQRQCHCTPLQIQRYLSKISGPLLDRIDIHLEVRRLKYEQMVSKERAESSKEIRRRVEEARRIQKRRLAAFGRNCNAEMNARITEEICILSNEAEGLLKQAILDLGLSARAYHKILKVARTIADLDKAEFIGSDHIAEAIGYRCLDRNLWIL